MAISILRGSLLTGTALVPPMRRFTGTPLNVRKHSFLVENSRWRDYIACKPERLLSSFRLKFKSTVSPSGPFAVWHQVYTSSLIFCPMLSPCPNCSCRDRCGGFARANEHSLGSDVCVRSFLYLFYTLIKLYYTKALSYQDSSLAPDLILLQRPRIPASSVVQQQLFILGACRGFFRTR